MHVNETARSLARLGVFALCLPACFNPESGDLDDAEDATEGADESDDGAPADAGNGSDDGGSTTSPDSDDADGGSSGDAGTGDDDDDDDDDDSTEGGSESGETGAEPVVACDDGDVVPGEVCFDVTHTLTGDDYAFAFLQDFDGDADRDLIYSASNGEVVVQFNADGAFGLSTTSSFMGVSSLDTMGFTDFNDDDTLDAILVSQSGGVFYAAEGNTSGDFALADGEGTESYDIAMGDMDGDGDLEIVALVLAGLRVYEVDTAGVITQVDATNISSFGAPRDVELADLNGDDQLDVLYLGPFDDAANSEVRVQLGNGDATLGGVELFPVLETTAAEDLALGDFDGDGETDIAVADGSTVRVTYGNGALGFSEAEVIDVSGTAVQVEAIDADGDGIDDLAVGYTDLSELTVHRGADDRTFADPVSLMLDHATEALSTGDINGDGVADLVVTSSAADALTVLSSTN